MPFSETWFLLEQEGLLAQVYLCNGLTALRCANTQVTLSKALTGCAESVITLS